MSWQARITKKILSIQLSGWSDGSVEMQRAAQEKTARFFKLPADILCQPVNVNGVPGEWIEAPGADPGTILYLHGGAYTLGSINTHRELVARLSRSTGMRALAIDYRLAPEHPYPAAMEDSVKAYRWLLAQGIGPAQMVIAGDSAGGGLTLATLLSLRDAGEPLPAGAVCISPWTDLACTGDCMRDKAKLDKILSPEGLSRSAKFYAGEHDLRTPLISPLYADLTGLPPLLIQVGTDEILLDDAIRVAQKAKDRGVDVTLEVWEEMFHVFQIVPFLAESKKALEHIGDFVSRILTNRL
jgi:acetyl esterase/lipase